MHEQSLNTCTCTYMYIYIIYMEHYSAQKVGNKKKERKKTCITTLFFFTIVHSIQVHVYMYVLIIHDSEYTAPLEVC